jgi:hypothetical protein
LYGINQYYAPVASFIASENYVFDFDTNIANYLPLTSEIIYVDPDTIDITYTVKLEEIPDNDGSIYLIDSKDKSYI